MHNFVVKLLLEKLKKKEQKRKKPSQKKAVNYFLFEKQSGLDLSSRYLLRIGYVTLSSSGKAYFLFLLYSLNLTFHGRPPNPSERNKYS